MIIANYIYSLFISILLVLIIIGYGLSYAVTKEKKKIICAVWFFLYIIGELFRMTLVILPNAIPFGIEGKILSYWGPIVPLCYTIVIKFESGKKAKWGEILSLGVLELTIIVLLALNITVEALYLVFYIWAPFELYSGKEWTKREKVLFFSSIFMLCMQILNRIILPLLDISTPDFSLSVCSEIMLYLSMSLGTIDVYVCMREYNEKKHLKTVNQKSDNELLLDKIASTYGLSKREQEIASLMIEGKSNKEIGETLCITEGTVKAHVHNLFQKLEINSRKELYFWKRSGK